jgi:hypothetical protein
MTKEVLKTVFAGILAGVALFMIPFFLIKVIIFFLLIKAIFRLLVGKRRWHGGGMRMAFVQKYNSMSEDERKAFMEKYGNRNCGWHSSCAPENNNQTK